MWQYAHRVGALVAGLVVGWTAVRTLWRAEGGRFVLQPAAVLLALLGLQIFLGALTIWSLRAIVPTTLHVATGSLVLATSVVLAVRVHRVAGEVA